MNVSEEFKFRTRGFSAKRVGYALAATSFGFIPAQFYGSCEQSIGVAWIGSMLLFAVAILAKFIPRGTPNRFRPLALAGLAVVIQILGMH